MDAIEASLETLSCRMIGMTLLCSDGSRWKGFEEEEATGGMFWVCIVMSLICVSTAALAAGLTMGLVSLESFDMELLLHTEAADLTDPDEKEILRREQWCAERIAPVISDHHRLLVTLLLLNACANEALPVFLERVVPAWAAILCSVTVVLFFGEIIPSAIFTGPDQLHMAAKFTPVVKFVQIILFPIVKPIAMVLDTFLGNEDKGRYNKAELKALVALHREGVNSGVHGSTGGKLPFLSTHEALVMQGALELNHKGVECAMMPMDKVYMLEKTDVLDLEAMANLVGFGHSRVPVWEGSKHNIRGILIVKSLICVDPNDKRIVESLGLRLPLVVPLGYPLMDLLKDFQTGKSHMAIVCSDPPALRKAWREGSPVPANLHMAGLITLEDVVEELIQSEIYDESDASVKETLAGVALKTKRINRLREVVKLWQVKAEREKSTPNAPSLLGKVKARIFTASSRNDSHQSLTLLDPLLSPRGTRRSSFTGVPSMAMLGPNVPTLP